MGMLYSDKEDLEILTNDHSLWSEQEIEFDLQNLTMCYIGHEANLLHTLNHEFFTAEPDIFNLGDSFISFLDIDFEAYNSILNDCIPTSYKVYYYSITELDYFISQLHENGIKHIYLESLDLGEYYSIEPERFKKNLSIDLDIISSLKNFLDVLCGLPYTTKKGTLGPMESLDYDINNIFSKVPLMAEKAYCEVYADYNTYLVKKCNFGKRYKNTCPLSFCVTELSKMLEANMRIKRCKNCGKYFIQKGGYNIDYCNRKYNEKGQSCKDIGATMHYKSKLESNPILKEYDRAYKRMYARTTNHKMSTEDFRLWAENATKKRDLLACQYEKSPSDSLITEFKQFLGNK